MTFNALPLTVIHGLRAVDTMASKCLRSGDILAVAVYSAGSVRV